MTVEKIGVSRGSAGPENCFKAWQVWEMTGGGTNLPGL
jgi:hypothetical protein